MSQYHDSPGEYLEMMRAALPLYEELEGQVAAAAADLEVACILDHRLPGPLGTSSSGWSGRVCGRRLAGRARISWSSRPSRRPLTR